MLSDLTPSEREERIREIEQALKFDPCPDYRAQMRERYLSLAETQFRIAGDYARWAAEDFVAGRTARAAYHAKQSDRLRSDACWHTNRAEGRYPQ